MAFGPQLRELEGRSQARAKVAPFASAPEARARDFRQKIIISAAALLLGRRWWRCRGCRFDAKQLDIKLQE
jgi:hypothetical protein